MKHSILSRIPLFVWGICLAFLLTAEAAKADLDPAFSGAWFDPEFSGAGFFVEVLTDDRALVYWFTYNDQSEQRWFIGVGSTSMDRIVIDELLEPTGAVFGDGFDPDDVVINTVGSAVIDFSECNKGRINFDVNGVSSSQQLTRLTAIRDMNCGASAVSDAGVTRPAVNQSGTWFNTGRSGEGFIVEVLADDRVLVDWFTFDPQGRQAWLTGIGHAADDYIFVEDMTITHGGLFGPDHDPDAVVLDHWGKLELRLNCDGGTVVYDAADSLWGQGFYSLSRLTEILDLECIHESFGPVKAEHLPGFWASDGFGVVGRVDTDSFSLMQVTQSSCIEITTGPTAGLLTLGDELTMTVSGNRLRFEGLDSVTPVDINRVASLPAHCLNGGTGASSDPVTVFNAFYDTLNELYSAFEIRGVDWSSERQRVLPIITSDMSQNALFNALSSMLDPLNDGHVSLLSPTRSFFSGFSPATSSLRARADSPAANQIIIDRLGGTLMLAANDVLRYGLTNNNIAYLEISRFNNILPNASQQETLEFLRPELDTIFKFFNDNDASGLILDVRRNSGGNFNYGMEIAGRLNRGVTRQIMSERRPTPSGLSTAIALTVETVDGIQFDGPVVLLTSKLTASAAEIFTFAIKALPHATLMGQPGIGVLSRTERVLPNNWLLSITPGQVEAPNGEVFEAVGIPVDIEVPTFPQQDLDTGKDSALDAAIEYLSPEA